MLYTKTQLYKPEIKNPERKLRKQFYLQQDLKKKKKKKLRNKFNKSTKLKTMKTTKQSLREIKNLNKQKHIPCAWIRA